MTGIVTALHCEGDHQFSKSAVEQIELVAGLGVAGDAHQGAQVRHRSRVKADPTQPNLRQVHLMHQELFEELEAAGHYVSPGELGENITTRGIDLLGLPTGSVLRLGEGALLGLTGLRNPCRQIEAFQEGLLSRVLGRDADGRVVRKAGVMAVVLWGGTVQVGDRIEISHPPGPGEPLAPV